MISYHITLNHTKNKVNGKKDKSWKKSQNAYVYHYSFIHYINIHYIYHKRQDFSIKKKFKITFYSSSIIIHTCTSYITLQSHNSIKDKKNTKKNISFTSPCPYIMPWESSQLHHVQAFGNKFCKTSLHSHILCIKSHIFLHLDSSLFL